MLEWMPKFIDCLGDCIEHMYDSYFAFAQTVDGVMIFGFSEFLTVLTLLMIVLSTRDYKYQFRLHISRFSKETVFRCTIVIGSVILVCDILVFWGLISHLTQMIFQLCGAIVFLFLVLYWVRVAFIKPPVFNKSNSRKYASEIVWACRNGDEEKIKVLAQELLGSMRSLVHLAPRHIPLNNTDYSEVEQDVRQIFSHMGTAIFCRQLIRNSVETAGALFYWMRREGKFSIGLDDFPKNYITEALKWENSFIFRETDFSNGGLNYKQPNINEIYGDSTLLLNLRGLIEPDFSLTRDWKPKQVRVYVEILSKAFDACYGVDPAMFSFYVAYEILGLNARSFSWGSKLDQRKRDVFCETMRFYENVISEVIQKRNFFFGKKHYSGDYERKDFMDYFVDSVADMFYCAGSIMNCEDDNYIMRSVLHDIFLRDEPQNDCIIFFERLKSAVIARVNDKTGICRIYTLFFFLSTCGLKEDIQYGVKALADLHRLLLVFAKEHLLEVYLDVSRSRTFEMPRNISIDVEKRELTLKTQSLFGDTIQTLQLD